MFKPASCIGTSVDAALRTLRIEGRKTAVLCEDKHMKNSNGDNLNDPMSETEFGQEVPAPSAQERLSEGARKFSQAASDTWDQTRQKAVVVRERTEFFLRENPVPTVLGALALGLAIGLAIRYSSRPEEPSASVKRALREFDWSSVTPAFLPGLMKSVKRGYAGSTEAVKEGIERVKDVDVEDYVKPLRKRWKQWVG
jgi:ElaB/YqjD/DUF883 family membrane-anchored ribosome-binding protein